MLLMSNGVTEVSFYLTHIQEVAMRKISISVGTIKLNAELNESPTAQKVWDALPITGSANVWGDEIYFEIPVSVPQESDARADVEVGTLAYWPVGSAFCIFYGPTPVSRGSQPRAYSPVNLLGSILDDARMLKGVTSGAVVTIERIE
jgi:hypothetical protein